MEKIRNKVGTNVHIFLFPCSRLLILLVKSFINILLAQIGLCPRVQISGTTVEHLNVDPVTLVVCNYVVTLVVCNYGTCTPFFFHIWLSVGLHPSFLTHL